MKKALAYAAAVLCGSYTVAGILYATGALNQSTRFVVSAFYMFLPAVVALIFDRIVYKNNLIDSWGLRFKFNCWLFSPPAIVLILVALTLAINPLFPGIRLLFDHIAASRNTMAPEQFEAALPHLEMFPPGLFYLMQIGSGFVAGYTINAVFAFGEEVGWRGYLLNLFKGRPFWQAWLFTGALWGVWHAPLILLGHNYPDHPRIGVAMMTLVCVLLTPMFIYVRVKTKSIWGPSFLHGFFNALSGLPHVMLLGGNDLTIGVTGFAGIIALVVMNAALFVFDVCITKDRILVSDVSF